jgi:predicted nucleic acid-binding protein
MSDTVWVINASPLILLGKLGRLDLIAALANRVMVPAAVIDEIAAGAGDATAGLVVDWARRKVDPDISVPGSIVGWDLGAGESQVLARCMSGSHTAVLDDGEARAAAKVHGVAHVGTLGVILRARRAGLIPAARPLIDELLARGSYLSANLVQDALRKLGE